MPNRSREKGNREERALVRFLQNHGFGAERIPLSGSAGGKFSGDISLPLMGVDRRVEVKVRGTGFKQIYKWLEEADLLIIRQNGEKPLVVSRIDFATRVAEAAEKWDKAMKFRHWNTK